MRRIVAALALVVGALIGPFSLPSYASCAAGFGSDPQSTLDMERVIAGTVTEVSGRVATMQVDQIWVGGPVAPQFRFYTSGAIGPFAHDSEEVDPVVGTKYLVGIDVANRTSACSFIPLNEATLRISDVTFAVPTADGYQGVNPSLNDKIVGANKYSLAFALAVLAGLLIYLKRRADKDSIE